MKFRFTLPIIPPELNARLRSFDKLGGATVSVPLVEIDVTVPDEAVPDVKAMKEFLAQGTALKFDSQDPTDLPAIQVEGEDGKTHRISIDAQGAVKVTDRPARS